MREHERQHLLHMQVVQGRRRWQAWSSSSTAIRERSNVRPAQPHSVLHASRRQLSRRYQHLTVERGA
jgi:hypothetical protein